MDSKAKTIYLKLYHFSIFGRVLTKNFKKKFPKDLCISIENLPKLVLIDFELLKRFEKNRLLNINFPQFLFLKETMNFWIGKKQKNKFFSFSSEKTQLNFNPQKEKFPAVQYIDFAGIKPFLSEIQELIEWPLLHWGLYQSPGIFSTRGILLTGPSGTGKTYLAHVIAGELRLPLLYVSAASIVCSVRGDGEKKIREIFLKAGKLSPSLIFIDEIDTISNQKENFSKETEKRILSQLLICLDKLRLKKNKKVIVLAATNRINDIDGSLRRPGRFDKEIKFSFPDYPARLEILQLFTSKLLLESYIDIENLALKTKGFTSGDLSELVKFAAMAAISRTGAKFLKGKYRSKNIKKFSFFGINQIDLERSIFSISPGVFRQGFAPPMEKSWKEVGGMEKTRKILSKYIIQPIKKPLNFLGEKKRQFGVLLYGPPGCGKTLVAQALAFESGASFISIKGPELLDKFLGESEKAIRSLFQKARTCPPSIIFFDEFDSIATKRSSLGNSSSQGATDRVVNQLLTEMDGTDQNDLLFFVAATNRPDMIDRALLRPGRIDKLIFIPFPNKKEKISIIKAISKKLPILPYLNFSILFDNFSIPLSGADISFCSKEAVLISREKNLDYCEIKNIGRGLITVINFRLASEDFSKSVSKIIKSSFSKKNFFLSNKKADLN